MKQTNQQKSMTELTKEINNFIEKKIEELNKLGKETYWDWDGRPEFLEAFFEKSLIEVKEFIVSKIESDINQQKSEIDVNKDPDKKYVLAQSRQQGFSEGVKDSLNWIRADEKKQIRQQFAEEIKKWIHEKSLREKGLRVQDIDEYLAKLIKE